jgi:hypothetical protein
MLTQCAVPEECDEVFVTLTQSDARRLASDNANTNATATDIDGAMPHAAIGMTVLRCGDDGEAIATATIARTAYARVREVCERVIAFVDSFVQHRWDCRYRARHASACWCLRVRSQVSTCLIACACTRTTRARA